MQCPIHVRIFFHFLAKVSNWIWVLSQFMGWILILWIFKDTSQNSAYFLRPYTLELPKLLNYNYTFCPQLYMLQNSINYLILGSLLRLMMDSGTKRCSPLLGSVIWCGLLLKVIPFIAFILYNNGPQRDEIKNQIFIRYKPSQLSTIFYKSSSF